MQAKLTTATISQSALQAFIAATASIVLFVMSFFLIEPGISHALDSNAFRIRQTIVDETSFLVQPSNVTMSGSGINGLTGGSATGTTSYVVRSNNASGYYVDIDFFDNAGPYAMRGDEDGGAQIRDYSGDVGGEPSINLTASTAAQFAYSNYSSTTSDTDDSFLHNGGNTTCNEVGGTQTIGRCWKSPSTTGFRIVDRSTAASAGATSTLYFRVHVPSGANPVPTAQTYTATATLSVFIQ